MDIVALDHSLTLLINSWDSALSDPVWIFFSNRWVWSPLYLGVAVVLVRKLGWKKGLFAILTLVLTILCVDQCCNLVKNTVMRPRPCNTESMVAGGLNILEKISGSYSFFSGHSANAFAFALGSVLLFRQIKPETRGLRLYTILIYLWASLVAISRVFVGKHYLGDVLAGCVAGLLLAFLVYLLMVRLVWSRLARACP